MLEKSSNYSSRFGIHREPGNPENSFVLDEIGELESSLILTPLTYRAFAYLPVLAPGYLARPIELPIRTVWPIDWKGRFFHEKSASVTLLKITGEVVHFFVRTQVVFRDEEGVAVRNEKKVEKSRQALRVNCYMFEPEQSRMQLKTCAYRNQYPPVMWEYKEKTGASHLSIMRFTRLIDQDDDNQDLPLASLSSLTFSRVNSKLTQNVVSGQHQRV
ncbi:MAG: hypothetical protein ACR2PT_22115 [Endozoicomonas sp.]